MRSLSLGFLAITLCLNAFAQNIPAQKVQLALDGGADLSPVYPTSKIPANARRFVAIFMFDDQQHHKVDTTMGPTEHGGSFTASKQGQTEVIAVGDKTRVLLRYSFLRDLPVGPWRLTVSVDDKPFAAQSFDVVPAAAPLKLSGPIDLAGSLTKGTEWTSEFRVLHEPRPGLEMTLEGATVDDGWLRTTATRRIVATDQEGVRADNYQSGKVISSTWTIATDKGIAVTKLESGGHSVLADPPELMVAWPVAGFYTSWRWHDKRQKPEFGHQFQMWGPVPIKTPKGEMPGYVLLQKIPDTSDSSIIASSSENGIVPGVGMVYTIGIQSVPQYQTAMRTEARLTSMKPGSGSEPEIRKYVESPTN